MLSFTYFTKCLMICSALQTNALKLCCVCRVTFWVWDINIHIYFVLTFVLKELSFPYTSLIRLCKTQKALFIIFKTDSQCFFLTFPSTIKNKKKKNTWKKKYIYPKANYDLDQNEVKKKKN